VKYLTTQERRVIAVVVGLLLLGWAVKAWRTAHPSAPAPGALESQSSAAAAPR
jgi:predicted metal-binding membrane protein